MTEHCPDHNYLVQTVGGVRAHRERRAQQLELQHRVPCRKGSLKCHIIIVLERNK